MVVGKPVLDLGNLRQNFLWAVIEPRELDIPLPAMVFERYRQTQELDILPQSRLPLLY
jgi:hypothetical protein